MADSFVKFSDNARLTLTFAQDEAQRFGHNYIGTEHLLLGLLLQQGSTARVVLEDLGVEPDRARTGVEFILGRGDQAVYGEIGLTPRAKKVIELAVDEARRMNHHYIGSEHLLLGLVREGEGIAAGVLESLGVNLERLRTEVRLVIDRGGGEDPSRPPGSPGATPPGPSPAERRARFVERMGLPPEEPAAPRRGRRAAQYGELSVWQQRPPGERTTPAHLSFDTGFALALALDDSARAIVLGQLAALPQDGNSELEAAPLLAALLRSGGDIAERLARAGLDGAAIAAAIDAVEARIQTLTADHQRVAAALRTAQRDGDIQQAAALMEQRYLIDTELVTLLFSRDEEEEA